MAISSQDFWRLLVESRLLPAADAGKLAAAAPAVDAVELARQLVAQRLISAYHAKVILAGRAGPFVYGDYKVLDRIDSGRLSGCFRAEHLPTRHRVVLTFLSGPQVADRATLERIRSSVASPALSHPRVFRAYELIDLGSFKFVVLADQRGMTLEEYLSSKKSIGPADACRLVRQAAEGLTVFHSVIGPHGEIRPSNLWIDPSGQLHVLSVPLASRARGIPDGAGAMADYLAPELSAAGAASASGDVYALGAVLYQLLAGQVPFAGGHANEKPRRHGTEAITPVDKRNPSVPRNLAQLVEQLLHKNPAARPATMARVIELIHPFSPVTGPPPANAPTAQQAAYEKQLTERHSRPAAAAVPRAPAVPQAGIPASIPMAAPIPRAMPPAHAAMPTGTPMAVAAPVTRVAGVPMAAPVAVPAPMIVAAPVMMSAEASIPVVKTTERSLASRHRTSSKRNRTERLFVGAVVGFLLLVGAVAVFVVPKMLNTKSKGGQDGAGALTAGPEQKPVETPVAAVTPKPIPVEPEEPQPAVSKSKEQIVALDDPLWESPTRGQPLDLKHFPPGVTAAIALRPSELLAHPEGSRLIAGLGPLGSMALETIKSRGGIEPQQVSQAIFGLIDTGPKSLPHVVLMIRTSEPVELDQLKSTWGELTEESVEGTTVWTGNQTQYFFPPEGKNTLWVVAPLLDEAFRKAWLTPGEGSPITPPMETLLRGSDAQAHLTVLAAPKSLTVNESLFFDLLRPLKQGLEDFLLNGDNELPKAAMFSLHLQEETCYGELRIHSADKLPTKEAAEYRQRLRGSWRELETAITSMTPSRYSALILRRLPDWTKTLGSHTRAGVDDRQIILRAYLPVNAAHNLVLGGQLAALEIGAGGGAAAPATTSTAGTGSAGASKTSISEILKTKVTSLSFAANAFEDTLKVFAEDIGVKIELNGKALEGEGVTRNFTVRNLEIRDKPAGQVLLEVLKKATPVGKDGVLVYLIKKQGDTEILHITTRPAALAAKEKLPPELEMPPTKGDK